MIKTEFYAFLCPLSAPSCVIDKNLLDFGICHQIFKMLLNAGNYCLNICF